MESFKNLYKIVFDSDGSIKACGRDAVRKLILEADRIEPEISHGNVDKGMMNEHTIKKLYASIT